jgi:hypothetical protein
MGSQKSRSKITVGKPNEYLFLTTDRDGCLRFANVFLRAAIAPIDEKSDSQGLYAVRAELPTNHELQTNSSYKILGDIRRIEAWSRVNDVS